jgi:hypothetical protein
MHVMQQETTQTKHCEFLVLVFRNNRMWAHMRNGRWNPKCNEHEIRRKMPKNRSEAMVRINWKHITKNM